MLIIWLQGIWLPLHGYSYESTPFWAGIYLLPLTVGFLVSGPISGTLSDRFGARTFATAGLLLVAVTFVALLLIPVNFEYWVFAILTFLNGVGLRHVRGAEPHRDHEQRSGESARGGIRHDRHLPERGQLALDRHLLLADDRRARDHAADTRCARAHRARRAAPTVANQVAATPPVGSLFAAFLGYNPIASILRSDRLLDVAPGRRTRPR